MVALSGYEIAQTMRYLMEKLKNRPLHAMCCIDWDRATVYRDVDGKQWMKAPLFEDDPHYPPK